MYLVISTITQYLWICIPINQVILRIHLSREKPHMLPVYSCTVFTFLGRLNWHQVARDVSNILLFNVRAKYRDLVFYVFIQSIGESNISVKTTNGSVNFVMQPISTVHT